MAGGYAYLKDNANDNGGVPSWYAGEDPFWESPDIFVVPHGAPEPGVNDVSEDFALNAGTPYDVWLRVNNDFGCDQVKGVKTLIFGADPDLGFQFWGPPVTGGSQSGNYVYVDNNNNPGGPGVTIPAYGQFMMGPFQWAPANGGHKCLLAAVEATGEPAPAPSNASLPAAYMSNQVAQRNLQISDGTLCTYNISNTSGSDVDLLLSVSVSPASPAPGSSGGPVITLTFDDVSKSWYNTWVAQGLSVVAAAGQTIITLQTSHLALNTVTVPSLQAGQSAPTVKVSLSSGPLATVGISSTLTAIPNADGGAADILVQNGGSCKFTAPVANPCAPGFSFCGTVCVNEASDPANCGSCGNSCGGFACSGGSCQIYF